MFKTFVPKNYSASYVPGTKPKVQIFVLHFYNNISEIIMLNNYTDGKIRQGYKFGYIRTNYSTGTYII